ncbi:DNA polymerase I [Patescibacteria group bacterium]|jgi:DNA polymerase-1|nr:DNA polymerase I [Patescibacteria group bacterium]
MKRLFILDANALLHRTWHAIRPLTNPEGLVVNCVYGMMMSAFKLIQEQKPDCFVACWDTEAATFRHEAYEQYKANRVQKEDELYAQIPWIKEGLEYLGVESLELDGYEADDLIGTIATKAAKKGWEVVIVTGDRDALQLIGKGVTVLAFKKGLSETKLYDEDAVKEEYGLSVEQFLEYKAMRGDPSDNIPGIKGIGEKGATDLLQRFGSLKNILKAARDKKSDLSDSTRAKLLDAEKEIPLLMKLVTIDRDVPIKWMPEPETFPHDQEKLLGFLHRMGFRSLLSKMPGSKAEKAKAKKERIVKEKPSKKSLPKMASGDVEDVMVENEKRLDEALEVLREGLEIAVFVPADAQRTLFADTGSGMVLASKDRAFHISDHLMGSSMLKDFLLDPAQQFVAHDTKSELRKLERYGLSVAHWSFDTMLAGYLLGAGDRNHDLDALVANFLNVQIEPDAPPFRTAELILKLVPLLRAKLVEENLVSVFERFELPLVPILRAMEREGIMIDKKHLADLSKQMSKLKKDIEAKMMKIAGREFNPGSPTQLAEILFTHLALPTKGVKKGKTGFSTAAPELEKLRGSHPIIEMIEDYREVSKLLSTYVDVLPTMADKNDRVHTTYNQAIAATGRLSSTDPNLQNIPIRTELGREIRHAFVAKPGFLLLSCDYSQIELRLVALLAKDKNMIAAFQRGEDIHTATAAAIFGVDGTEVTKDQRRIAKAINFGLIFGQGPQGLAQVAGITFAEAKEFIAKYFEVYKGVREYMVETKASAHSLGYVETLFGRKRYLPEIHSMMAQVRAQAERMAINMPVQGTDADLMKLSMIAIFPKLPDVCPEARLLLQVHDELVFEVPKKDVELVAAFVKNSMETVEKLDVPIVVEAKAGTNWDDMEKIA